MFQRESYEFQLDVFTTAVFTVKKAEGLEPAETLFFRKIAEDVNSSDKHLISYLEYRCVFRFSDCDLYTHYFTTFNR